MKSAVALVPSSDQNRPDDYLYRKITQMPIYIFCFFPLGELAEWIFQLAQVQEHLSHFRFSNALNLLNKLNPFVSQFSLSLELRARIFFENGEYKRACEVGYCQA